MLLFRLDHVEGPSRFIRLGASFRFPAFRLSVRRSLSLLPLLLEGREAPLALAQFRLLGGYRMLPFLQGRLGRSEVSARDVDRLGLRRKVQSERVEFLVILIGLLASRG